MNKQPVHLYGPPRRSDGRTPREDNMARRQSEPSGQLGRNGQAHERERNRSASPSGLLVSSNPVYFAIEFNSPGTSASWPPLPLGPPLTLAQIMSPSGALPVSGGSRVAIKQAARMQFNCFKQTPSCHSHLSFSFSRLIWPSDFLGVAVVVLLLVVFVWRRQTS